MPCRSGKARWRTENTPEAYVGQINAKACAKNPLEIDATRAHNSILLQIGAGLHEAPQFLPPGSLQCRSTFGCHTFRATGIIASVKGASTLENAEAMATHESPRTTKFF